VNISSRAYDFIQRANLPQKQKTILLWFFNFSFNKILSSNREITDIRLTCFSCSVKRSNVETHKTGKMPAFAKEVG
jgi:hypothetical protein